VARRQRRASRDRAVGGPEWRPAALSKRFGSRRA
jgi:hypothetical protein